MTFLEILNWMSESEENVAYSSGGFFKMEDNYLYVKLHNGWEICKKEFSFLNNLEWSKSEPSPEEVEVVAYQDVRDGEIRLTSLYSDLAKEYYENNKNWRKVRVKWGMP